MRNSNVIKNLSIALEALSRMPGYEFEANRVRGLLNSCLEEDENPSKVTHVNLNPDEEIPF